MAAASVASGLGAKTAITEKLKLGGDCSNIACVPTKALLHSANLFFEFKQAEKYGLKAESVSFDWEKVQEWKDAVVARRVANESEESLKEQGVDLYWGQTAFTSANQVKVGGEVLTSKKFIITAGSQPAVVPIEGLEEVGYITSNEAVVLKSLPKSILIIGGGAVGTEFSVIFSRFGVDATVFEVVPQIIPAADLEAANALQGFLEKQGIKFHVSAKVLKLEKDGNLKKAVVALSDGQTGSFTAEEIMMATGRRPDLGGLNLQAVGVETSQKGIPVDNTLKTNIEHIYAAGDVTGVMLFTHMATYQGTYAAYNALSGKKAVEVDYTASPWVVFSDPEIAGVGKTEEKLKQEKVGYKKSVFEFKNLGKADTQDRYDGFVKILVEEGTGQTLGAFIVGPEAGELIHEIVVAMVGKVPIDVVGKAIFAYPTWSEAVGSAAAEF